MPVVDGLPPQERRHRVYWWKEALLMVAFYLLYWKRPGVFPVWRNSLGIMTGLAIVGFALFPLMPPRLLDKPCDHYGGSCIESDVRPPGGFGFTDTLSDYGGPWSFDSDEM